jgi:small subunit ribosomal protein S20
MANTKSAAKRARQTIRRTAVNRRDIRKVKETLKNVREELKSGDKAKAQEAARVAISTLDSAAKKGRIHKNKANRQKSILAKALAGLAAKA